MDKDLIRIIIFAIGLAIIMGMIAWSYLQNEKIKRSYENYNDDDAASEFENSDLSYNSSDDEIDLEDDDYEAYLDTAEEQIESPKYSAEGATHQNTNFNDANVTPTFKKLALIQFSIVSLSDEGFSGRELFDVLDDAGLEYGNLQIFERLDARRLVDFGVASMVKPGIFPSTNLAAFHSPGIVFFMQPAKLDKPVAIFDDFIRTFKFVAQKLNGEMWDHQREILTEETIAKIRYSLGK